MEEYQIRFRNRTLKHIETVNKYAKMIGHVYPHHDVDKLGPLFKGYSLSFKEMTPEEYDEYNKATIKHILSNPHHPEYFLNRADKKLVEETFTRLDPPMGLDCTKMSDEGIIEMCCDWCAMSEEFWTNPGSWFDRTVALTSGDSKERYRGVFNNDQYDLIVRVLNRLGGDNGD